LWLDGADSSSASMTLSGSTITNWKDKSGNGVTFTIGGTPTLSNAAYNSLSSVYFNGSSTNFYNTTFSLNLVNHSFFIVTYQPTGGNVGVLVFHITGTGTDDVYSPNALQFASPEFGVQGSYGAQPYSNLTYGIYGDVATPTNNSLILYKNGTSVITKTNLVSRSSTGIAIGSRVYSGGYTYFMTGYVSEVIVYNTALTDIQRKSIEGYLGWKWGIQANLPAGHPYLTYSPKSGVGAGTSPLQITLGNVLSSTATAFVSDGATYTIPPKTSKLRIFVWGGGGNGNNYGASGCGGSGAHVQGDFTVGSISSLTIYLNRGAGPGHFGNNGAGYGAVFNATTGYLLIAGGGGGSGSGYGGGGGYLQGFNGGSPSIAGQVSVQSTAALGSGGGGGSQTQGGAGALSAQAGSYLQGGASESSAYPSGGGGGYYGGGGANGNGGTGRSGNGPGGGGSSYINTSYITNYRGEDGQSGSTVSVLPGGASSPYYVAGYGVGGRLTNGGGALVVIVPYLSGGGGAVATTGSARITLANFPITSGGVITTSGPYKVHTFRTVGTATFTTNKQVTAEVLVVGGGGGGGNNVGGGGGAGAALYSSVFSIPAGSYTITVGGGGAPDTNGSSSIFSSLTAVGGGRGGTWRGVSGASGGCGGGGGPDSGIGGAGTVGFAGGNPQGFGAGGGGGMGSAGLNAVTGQNVGGAGGLGATYSVGGASYLVCGGGAGSSYRTASIVAAGGSGIGGGGANSELGPGPTNPTPNTGSGGGGGAGGTSGASGIIVIALIPYLS
jgi:hypothetical protein